MRATLMAMVLAAGIVSVLPHPAPAGEILENFSSGTLGAWTSTGAWFVEGTTNSSPNLLPPNGLSYQALSSAPNQPSEAAVGTLTSPEYKVSFTTLTFLAAGWSGSGSVGNGESYYQILGPNLQMLTTTGTAQVDGWVTKSVNLLSLGLTPGEGFFLRAVDGRDEYGAPGGNYSWMGIDLVQETGAAVPEPASIVLMIIGFGAMAGARLTRRR